MDKVRFLYIDVYGSATIEACHRLQILKNARFLAAEKSGIFIYVEPLNDANVVRTRRRVDANGELLL